MGNQCTTNADDIRAQQDVLTQETIAKLLSEELKTSQIINTTQLQKVGELERKLRGSLLTEQSLRHQLKAETERRQDLEQNHQELDQRHRGVKQTCVQLMKDLVESKTNNTENTTDKTTTSSIASSASLASLASTSTGNQTATTTKATTVLPTAATDLFTPPGGCKLDIIVEDIKAFAANPESLLQIETATDEMVIPYDLDGRHVVVTKLSSETKEESKTNQVAQWYYDASDGQQHMPIWQSYDRILSEQLEKALFNNTTIAYSLNDFTYHFDLAKRTQTNTTTKKIRKIQRLLVSPSRVQPQLVKRLPPLFRAPGAINPIAAVSEPRHQQHHQQRHTHNRVFHRQPMDRIDQKYLVDDFIAKWTSDVSNTARSSPVITFVERFVNIPSLHMYRAKATCMPDTEELVLFHGTSATDYMAVATEGLDMRFAHANVLYGPAIYLSESPFYCHKRGYAHKPAAGATQVLLVVRALVGKTCNYGEQQNKALKRPPDGYDSVSAVLNHSRIYAIYDNAQCIVEAAIHYSVA